MPWCIAYGCNSSTHMSSSEINVHRLLLNNPPVAEAGKLHGLCEFSIWNPPRSSVVA